MALHAPKTLSTLVIPETGLSMVDAEIMAETASSLGHHGRKTEAALEALSVADADHERLVRVAAREVWAYFIQRELCGMRDHRLIIREIKIPQRVLNQMGAS